MTNARPKPATQPVLGSPADLEARSRIAVHGRPAAPTDAQPDDGLRLATDGVYFAVQKRFIVGFWPWSRRTEWRIITVATEDRAYAEQKLTIMRRRGEWRAV